MSDDNLHQPLEFIPPSIDHLAELLPAYSFEKLIAAGGMGAVYKATQTSLDRPVAVKVLPPELGESESFRESFVKEAKLMARLNHPNLISVYDFGEIEGLLYIVMEFVDGVTLYEKTYRGYLDQQEALEATIAICRGLANAHEAGILHRDIKPANIFINQEGTPKIGDFGLARPSGDTETGVIFGTPGYTSPEVLEAPEKVGPATDIFAVGIMLYELLAGKIPGDIYEPITKHAKCDPMIDRFIRKAIAPNLSQRYTSSEDFADDLDDIFRKAKKQAKSSLTFITKSSSEAPLLAKVSGKTASVPLLTQPISTPIATTPLKATASTDRPARPKPKSPPQKAKSTSGSGNTRNFIIIFILLGVIYGVLQWKKAKDEKNARIEQMNKNAELLAAEQKKAQVPKISQQKKPKTKDFSHIPAARKLTTLETLLKLRTRLAAGDLPLAEMPKVAISLDNGKRLILFVDKEMTWHQAELFATAHGAQLATVASSSDISALSKAIPPGERAWIGAATAGNKQWAWADGTPWTNAIGIRATSKLAFAQLDSDMFATAEKSNAVAKFLIEWKTDGSKPTDIKRQMERVSSTLSNPTPLYPAGSVTFGNRSFYLCQHSLTLSQAQELASSAGAHIATPSDAAEIAYFSDFISTSIPSGRLCRIGGFLDNSEWKWLNGEEWKSAIWDDLFPKNKNSIVVAASSGKWRDVPQDRPIAYTLFEWSNDAPSSDSTTQSLSKGPSNSAFVELQSKASKLVKAASDKRDLEHTENIKRLKWDLEVYASGLPKNDRARQAPSIQSIKKLIDGESRVKKIVSGMGSSAKVQKLSTGAYDKTKRIDSAYGEAIDKIRNGYQTKLRKIIVELESKSQLTAAKQAKTALDASSKGPNDFVQTLK